MSRLAALAAGWLTAAAIASAALADGRILHEKASAFSTIVVTDEGDGVRALRFGRNGVRQSLARPGDPDYLGLPYVRSALAGLALAGPVRRVLVIGLGAGTLPVFLHKHFSAATIDAVEIDPEVVRVAKAYFGLKVDERLRVHVADGRRFIEAVRLPYDVIFLDAYGADTVPAHLTTREFLAAVRRAVEPGGIVIGNVWSRDTNRLYDSMVRTYEAAFETLAELRVTGSGNRILLALPRRETVTRAAFARRARELSETRGFPLDLGREVERGYVAAAGSGWGGRVLVDADIKR